MTREEARPITLYEFIHYMSDDEPFQICFKDDEWDDFVELTSASKLLRPFVDCRIDCMGATLSVDGKRPVIRISIDEKGMLGYESI